VCGRLTGGTDSRGGGLSIGGANGEASAACATRIIFGNGGAAESFFGGRSGGGAQLLSAATAIAAKNEMPCIEMPFGMEHGTTAVNTTK
jgi:hypothetical protein